MNKTSIPLSVEPLEERIIVIIVEVGSTIVVGGEKLCVGGRDRIYFSLFL